jgi:hypothetical protein
MEAARLIARTGLRILDHVYRVRHGLERVGPVLLVGRDRYDGLPRQFPDGTELRAGDALGTLHFDNARIAAVEGEAPTAIGVRFTRLLFESLRELAERAREDAAFGGLAVFRGIGWHHQGSRLGFVSEPFPEGARKRYLAVHIGLLVWAFAPARGTAIAAQPEPRVIWMTRAALLKRFAAAKRPQRAPIVQDAAQGSNGSLDRAP